MEKHVVWLTAEERERVSDINIEKDLSEKSHDCGD